MSRIISSVDRDQTLSRLRERIVRYAASKLSEDSAEDVAQEVLMVLHEKYAAVDGIEDLLPLSLEIARFKIWGARRKTVRRGENTAVSVDDLPLAGAGPDPLEQTETRQRIDRLEAALLQLGDRCRELFRLKLEGYSFPEIQKRLKVESMNTLYTWDFRCRKQLAEKLNG
jgi:RNA polymerase sigma-70 factor, ECF subfamily